MKGRSLSRRLAAFRASRQLGFAFAEPAPKPAPAPPAPPPIPKARTHEQHRIAEQVSQAARIRIDLAEEIGSAAAQALWEDALGAARSSADPSAELLAAMRRFRSQGQGDRGRAWLAQPDAKPYRKNVSKLGREEARAAFQAASAAAYRDKASERGPVVDPAGRRTFNPLSNLPTSPGPKARPRRAPKPRVSPEVAEARIEAAKRTELRRADQHAPRRGAWIVLGKSGRIDKAGLDAWIDLWLGRKVPKPPSVGHKSDEAWGDYDRERHSTAWGHGEYQIDQARSWFVRRYLEEQRLWRRPFSLALLEEAATATRTMGTSDWVDSLSWSMSDAFHDLRTAVRLLDRTYRLGLDEKRRELDAVRAELRKSWHRFLLAALGGAP